MRDGVELSEGMAFSAAALQGYAGSEDCRPARTNLGASVNDLTLWHPRLLHIARIREHAGGFAVESRIPCLVFSSRFLRCYDLWVCLWLWLQADHNQLATHISLRILRLRDTHTTYV